jgi:TolB-like protein/predicted Zn-dependent protease
VWWDREIRAGSDFALEIEREIAAARVVVVLWSDTPQQSHWVRDEAAFARDRNKLLPICLGAAEPPLGFRQVQALRLDPADASGDLVEVTDAVRGILSGIAHPPTPPASPRRGARTRGIVAASLGAIAIALTVLFVRAMLPSAASTDATGSTATLNRVPASEKSIAVLPFADMSENHDQEYLADGMTEEIINLLAQVSDLLVPARTSAFYFKGKDVKITDIARELGVAHVLEGSIRRAGNHLRVTAQLVRAENGFHLWSETYDRELSDVFALQDEIANTVAQALQIRLTGGELNRRKGGTRNLEAYQLLLRSYSAGNQSTATSFDEALRDAEEAARLDPEYGLAWSQQAYVTSTKADNALSDGAGAYPRARQLAMHALELSPDIAETHALLQRLYVTLDWDWAAAAREEKMALAIDPTDPPSLQIAGTLAAARGRWDDAERLFRLALTRDPLSSWVLFGLANTYYGAGRLDKAIETYRKLAEVEPNFQWTRIYLSKALLEQDDVQGSFDVAEAETDPGLLVYSRPLALLSVDRAAEADAALETEIAEYGGINAYAIALVYAYRGDRDRALEWLEMAYEQKNSGLLEIVGEPLFRKLCGDPRFDAFMRKMNLPPISAYPFRGV